MLTITSLRSSSSDILPRAYSYSLASHSSDNSIPENDMLACEKYLNGGAIFTQAFTVE